MRITFFRFNFCMLFFLLAIGMAEAKPLMTLSTEKVDLGTVFYGGQADGTFLITNEGDSVLTIESLKPSCGCTVANFSTGEIFPGEMKEVHFTIDTTGKVGDIKKNIVILSDDVQQPKRIVDIFIHVQLVEHQEMDKSAIFKGDCAACHAEPAQYRVDEELFEMVCYMCHGHYGLGGGATRINEFSYLTKRDDSYLRKVISEGITERGMPAFSNKLGGPLDDEQIESLVSLMRWWEEGYLFRENAKRYGQ